MLRVMLCYNRFVIIYFILFFKKINIFSIFFFKIKHDKKFNSLPKMQTRAQSVPGIVARSKVNIVFVKKKNKN